MGIVPCRRQRNFQSKRRKAKNHTPMRDQRQETARPLGERLNKWLGRMGVCSRREADRLIEAGRVYIDGQPAAIGQSVLPGQKVEVDGRAVADGRKPSPVLLAVNKPRGIVCTTSDKDRAENIVEFLKYPERIYPVGRLDKDSQGLLLMTNQGDLVNRIMRAGNAHEKEYHVTIDRPVTSRMLERMAAGIWLEDLKETTRPCRVRRLGEREFSIVLTQGLNRQIRRMCEACGCRVRRLVRVRIMNIRLGDLAEGAFRPVEGREYQELMELLKGSSSLSAKERAASGQSQARETQPKRRNRNREEPTEWKLRFRE